MKFQVNRDALSAALGLVCRAVPNRPVRPILEGVRVEMMPGGTIRLSATDLDVAIVARVNVEASDETGSTVLPAVRLQSLIRELGSEEPLSFSIDGTNCRLSAGKAKFKIITADPTEFPELPDLSAAKPVTIRSEKFKRMGRCTGFAVAKDRSQYALNGVLILAKADSVDAVGSDGRRLAVLTVPAENPSGEAWRVIVPPSAIDAMSDAVGSAEGAAVDVRASATHVSFKYAGVEVSARLVEGEYPDHEMVIPKQGEMIIDVASAEFARALRAAENLTSAHTSTVKIEVASTGGIVIRSLTPDLGEAEVGVEAKVEGPDIAIGFNPAFLLDAVKVAGVERVSLSLSKPDGPGLFNFDEGFRYVAMPMSID